MPMRLILLHTMRFFLQARPKSLENYLLYYVFSYNFVKNIVHMFGSSGVRKGMEKGEDHAQ